MNVTSAAKVGFTAIVVILALWAVNRELGWDLFGFPGTTADSYKIYASFETVKGLNRGADVQLNGNPIGEVEAIDNDGFGGVLVTLTISSRRAIHEHADFVISRDSIFGSYLVSINEPRSGSMTTQIVDNQFTIRVGTNAVIEGGPVYYHGEQIGEVISIEPLDFRTDHAIIHLTSEVDVSDKMAFVPQTVFGSQPAGIQIYDKIPAETTIVGTREPGPEDLVADADMALMEITQQAGALMEQLGTLLEKVSESLEPEEIRAALDTITTEAEIIASNISLLTIKLNNLLDQTQHHLIATTENIESITGEAHELVVGLNDFNSPENRENIEEIIRNLTDASDRLVSILDDIEQYSSDDEFREDIKGTIHEARQTIVEARDTLDVAEAALGDVTTGMNIFGGINTEAEFVLRDHPNDDRWAGDVNVRVGLEGSDTFIEAGVDDIGEDDALNAQIGWWIEPDISARIGIHRGKLGVGTEFIHNEFRIKGDLYDLNSLQWDIYAGYAIIPELDLIVGIEDLLDDDEVNFGLAYHF